jgi:hypothetical protein
MASNTIKLNDAPNADGLLTSRLTKLSPLAISKGEVMMKCKVCGSKEGHVKTGERCAKCFQEWRDKRIRDKAKEK